MTTHPLDLDGREEAAFRSRFDDGLADLLIGLAVLAMGATLGTELGGMAGVWGALVVPLWLPLHKAITEPRLGYVEFGPGRRAKMRRKQLVLTGALGTTVLAGLLLWYLSAKDGAAVREALHGWEGLPFLASLAAVIVVAGVVVHARRALAYGGVLLLGGLLTKDVAAMDPLRLALMIGGAVITATGAALLVRFLRSHPRLEEGTPG